MTVFQFFGCFSLCLVFCFFFSGFLLFPSFHESSTLNICSSLSAFTQAGPDQTEPGWTRQKPSTVSYLPCVTSLGRKEDQPFTRNGMHRAGPGKCWKTGYSGAGGTKRRKGKQRRQRAPSRTYICKGLTTYPSTRVIHQVRCCFSGGDERGFC